MHILHYVVSCGEQRRIAHTAKVQRYNIFQHRPTGCSVSPSAKQLLRQRRWAVPPECGVHSADYRNCAIVPQKKLCSVALVRERTIPTERPPLVGEVSANFSG
jgi:hypothetical protein